MPWRYQMESLEIWVGSALEVPAWMQHVRIQYDFSKLQPLWTQQNIDPPHSLIETWLILKNHDHTPVHDDVIIIDPLTYISAVAFAIQTCRQRILGSQNCRNRTDCSTAIDNAVCKEGTCLCDSGYAPDPTTRNGRKCISGKRQHLWIHYYVTYVLSISNDSCVVCIMLLSSITLVCLYSFISGESCLPRFRLHVSLGRYVISVMVNYKP